MKRNGSIKGKNWPAEELSEIKNGSALWSYSLLNAVTLQNSRITCEVVKCLVNTFNSVHRVNISELWRLKKSLRPKPRQKPDCLVVTCCKKSHKYRVLLKKFIHVFSIAWTSYMHSVIIWTLIVEILYKNGLLDLKFPVAFSYTRMLSKWYL
jgi:hypothetical protein